MPAAPKSVLALDVGTKRIGDAVANLIARLPHSLPTLTTQDTQLMDALQEIVRKENVQQLVVGLPRGLEGQHTDQTNYSIRFGQKLADSFELPIDYQDEALTSQKAQEELQKSGKHYQPEDVDALAATYILEDWLSEHTEQDS